MPIFRDERRRYYYGTTHRSSSINVNYYVADSRRRRYYYMDMDDSRRRRYGYKCVPGYKKCANCCDLQVGCSCSATCPSKTAYDAYEVKRLATPGAGDKGTTNLTVNETADGISMVGGSVKPAYDPHLGCSYPLERKGGAGGGIVVGVIIGTLVLFACVFVCYRRDQKKRAAVHPNDTKPGV